MEYKCTKSLYLNKICATQDTFFRLVNAPLVDGIINEVSFLEEY